MNRRRFFRISAISSLLLAFISTAPGAVERFEDINVTPQSLVSGETYHGYREFRVLIENRSLKDTHVVTLVYPDRSYVSGNSIDRITRSVSLGPTARASVPFWQPALPAGGGNMQVLIDDESAGSVNLPGAGRHMSRSGMRYGGSPIPATILISRGLNFDEADRALKPAGTKSAFTAGMATGAPDSGGRPGAVPTSWMPEVSSSGPHWIELEYDTPVAADRVRVYGATRLFSGMAITVRGASGTNLAQVSVVPPAPVSGSRRPPEVVREFTFALTAESVKTVRLDFKPTPGGSVNVDAVEVAGPAGSAWAATARASSEATGSPPGGFMPPSASGIASFEPRELLRSELPVAEWSEHWLSYTPYDAIALSAADLRTAPAAIQTALCRYAECGGNLILLGGGEIPDTWRALPNTTLAGGKAFVAGFGRCFVFETDLMSGLTPAAVKVLMNAANTSARYWQMLPDESSANAAFPVIENVRIPVRGTVLIMLVFVILIGPVNLIVLSRLNRRTWLLWTIPAISLLTCLVVFVYSLLREGITPDVRLEGLTLLDQANRRATSVGTTAFYCPLTPSQGLFFGSETEATPLVQMFDYSSRFGGRRDRGTQRQVDWTQSQHLTRGWVTARVPAHFQMRKSETRRERIQLEDACGKPAAVNGLGAVIRSLCLADRAGRIYTATGVAAGARVKLLASAGPAAVAGQFGVGSFFERPGYAPPESLMNNAAALLQPGTYLAELETNPFLENALGSKASSRRTRTRCVVFGILEPAARP